MVTAARPSAPAKLTQQHVDDLRAGRGVDAAAKALHAVRRPAAVQSARATAGSAPLPLTPDDLRAIARNDGAAPEALSTLIAALARPAAPATPKARAARKLSAPVLKRPGESGAD